MLPALALASLLFASTPETPDVGIQATRVHLLENRLVQILRLDRSSTAVPYLFAWSGVNATVGLGFLALGLVEALKSSGGQYGLEGLDHIIGAVLIGAAVTKLAAALILFAVGAVKIGSNKEEEAARQLERETIETELRKLKGERATAPAT